ncbi:hypothetical protein PF005_g18326 [Phytophthora fragariae]|uniref:Uncharacterized protein n=1 Tax=Phytophthora fragariae TaxID=53985 RepID=A0A6A3X5K6_9STRA|nr:hypothetical protein PF003_g38957 [Phytophthora fragariae]KAE8930567.1 hypothetical protein PF009_g19349 [Phytophthora fragariae]KAE8989187.1 hypothetical protein PF011_g18874 [Phytophthora fragariae]KAE9092724.1 hypothetical protein PF007_g18379 [Phytophthora fragariae]KAE9092754.1 hypothetical protein PF010_g17732 [Phytophthora fragariae]
MGNVAALSARFLSCPASFPCGVLCFFQQAFSRHCQAGDKSGNERHSRLSHTVPIIEVRKRDTFNLS